MVLESAWLFVEVFLHARSIGGILGNSLAGEIREPLIDLYVEATANLAAECLYMNAISNAYLSNNF